MTASLSDILTTQKNGVIAINGLNQTISTLAGSIDATLAKIYSNFKSVLFFRGPATISVSTLYAAPAGNNACITDMMIVNTSSNAATFYIYGVPPSGVAIPGNAIFYGSSIPGNTSVQWTGNQVVEAGGTVQASASATSVTFSVTGVLNT